MIVAAATTAGSTGPFNWFDVLLILIVAFGLWRGRKRGMSKEFLSVFEALILVIVCGIGYDWGSTYLAQSGVIKTLFGGFDQRTAACMTSYVVIGLLVVFLFSFIKRQLKPKLEGSNIFGGSEYYLGMIGGMIRYVCYLLIGLALLNAPIYGSAEIAKQKAYDKQHFGGGIYDGNYFLRTYTIQDQVFKESLIGPSIKSNLGIWLINVTPAEVKKTAKPPAA